MINLKLIEIVNKLAEKVGMNNQELIKQGINWPYVGIEIEPDKINIVKRADNGSEELSIAVKNQRYQAEYSNSGILLNVYQAEKKDLGDQFSSHFINSIIENSKHSHFILESDIHENPSPKEISRLIGFYLKTHEKGKIEGMMEEYPFEDLMPRVYHEENGLLKDKKEKNIKLDYKIINPFSKSENRTEVFSISEDNSENLFFKLEDGKIIPVYTTMNNSKTKEVIHKNKAYPKLINLMKEAVTKSVDTLSSDEIISKEEATAMFKSFYNCFKQQPHTVL